MTYAYASGIPLDVSRTTVSDPAGTIVTTTDWLGRVVSYTDVWNKTTTTTYDQAGRVTNVTAPGRGPGGAALRTVYDNFGRVGGVDLDGARVATPTYDNASGTMSGVTYPAGAGTAGNATSGALAAHSRGRPSGLTWKLPGGATLASDAVTRSAAGRVVDQAIDGVDPRPGGDNFTYDAAARLSGAWVPGHAYTYGFAPTGGCGPLTGADRNTNRTSLADNASPAVSYCYGAGAGSPPPAMAASGPSPTTPTATPPPLVARASPTTPPTATFPPGRPPRRCPTPETPPTASWPAPPPPQCPSSPGVDR